MAIASRNRLVRWGWTLAIFIVVAASAPGCVERRYTLRTNPPGAIAIVNGEEIGPTPVSRSFVFYGDRDITFQAEGFETMRIVQPIKAPWWDSLPVEFFVENLVPITLRDEREFVYNLAPATNPPVADVLARGEGLKAEAQNPPPPRKRGILGWLGF